MGKMQLNLIAALVLSSAVLQCSVTSARSATSKHDIQQILKPLSVSVKDVEQDVDELFEQLMEWFRVAVTEGDPEIDMPPLDPFFIDYHKIDIIEDFMTAVIQLNDTTALGLAKYIVTHVETDLEAKRIDMTMTLHEFLATGLYDLDGLAWSILPLFGNGPFEFNLTDITFRWAADIVIVPVEDNKHIFQLENLEMNLDFEEISVYFENLLGGEDLGDMVNEIINSMGKNIFDSVGPKLNEKVSHAIETFANNKLKDIYFEDIAAGKLHGIKAFQATRPAQAARQFAIARSLQHQVAIARSLKHQQVISG